MIKSASHVDGKASLLTTLAVCASVLLTLVVPKSAMGQGCVASRGAGLPCGIGGMHGDMLGQGHTAGSGWQAAVGYRWLHSDRHFTGGHEDVIRQQEGSQVINDSHFIDVSATYNFTPRYSATLTFPLVYNDRSQVVRAGAGGPILERFHTQSRGLGDVRANGNMWLWDPTKPRKNNVLLGFGVDAPTGTKNAKDIFRVFRSGSVINEERTVDQSIQPGDGGWGFTIDMYGYQQIIPRLNAYVNGSYTFTPQNKNGVPTFRSNRFEQEMSIADAYVGRTGLEYVLWPKHGLTLSFGGRIEGVPVHDAIGGSEGFRRPGYAISVEPGLSAMVNSWTFSLYTPVAVDRYRQRSKADRATGPSTRGDAAFADFLVMCNISKRF